MLQWLYLYLLWLFLIRQLCTSLIFHSNTTHHFYTPNIPINTHTHTPQMFNAPCFQAFVLAILSYRPFLSSLWFYLAKINLVNTEMFLSFVLPELLLTCLPECRSLTIVMFCWHLFSISRVCISLEQNSYPNPHWNIVPATQYLVYMKCSVSLLIVENMKMIIYTLLTFIWYLEGKKSHLKVTIKYRGCG